MVQATRGARSVKDGKKGSEDGDQQGEYPPGKIFPPVQLPAAQIQGSYQCHANQAQHQADADGGSGNDHVALIVPEKYLERKFLIHTLSKNDLIPNHGKCFRPRLPRVAGDHPGVIRQERGGGRPRQVD
jgi:hypothetical protein